MNVPWYVWLEGLVETFARIFSFVCISIIVIFAIMGLTFLIRDLSKRWFKRVASRGGVTLVLVIFIYLLCRTTLIQEHTTYYQVRIPTPWYMADEWERRAIFDAEGYWTIIKIGSPTAILALYPIVSWVFWCVIANMDELKQAWANVKKWFVPEP